MSRVVYLNGQFVPESEAKISIYDLSVMQAAAAFEMTRSFNGQHFKLDEHIARLRHSLELLQIPDPHPDKWDYHEFCGRVTLLNDHGPGEEHRLLIVVSPGCAPMYHDLAGVIPHPFLYIADFPLRYTVRGFGKYFTEGVHCVTSKIQQVPDNCVPSSAKHRSRLHFHLAQQQAPEGAWPILTTSDGLTAEAPGANLVAILNRTQRHIIYFQEAALPGISRDTVRELVGGSIPEYCHSPMHDVLYQCEELWLTGTPFCMLPVVSLDGKPIGDGTVGPIYKATLQKWNEFVELDIAKQIQNWDTQTVWTPDAQRTLTNQH